MIRMLRLLHGTEGRIFMNKIGDAFKDETAFVAYLMAGDPDLDSSAEYILTAQEAGADLVEIGIPFSDPVAEGDVIQQASLRALDAGARLNKVFDMVESIKDKMRVPMAFMTYLNPVYVYGYERFFSKCVDIGISGVIIPDLPYEEQEEVKSVAVKYGVAVITLIAPTSKERVAEIAAQAEGFIYLVSSMGVTGVRSDIVTDVASIIGDIKKVTDIPVGVGFGISTPQQAKDFAVIADGVIVGSAIVKIIGDYGKEANKPLYDYIKSMTNAIV